MMDTPSHLKALEEIERGAQLPLGPRPAKEGIL